MMIIFQKSFEKRYKKLPDKVKQKVKEKNLLFAKDPFDSILGNHALVGKYSGYRSINVTGDFRIVYKMLNDDIALFVDIGTHSQLYK